MTIEVLTRKKEFLINYLQDLKKYENYTFKEFLGDHYAVERLLELLVGVSCDIVFHLLSERDEAMPSSYRAVFLRAGEVSLISPALAQRLAKAAGMRNILIHGYEKIDLKIVYQSIQLAIKDYSLFLSQIEKQSIDLKNHKRQNN